MPVDLEIITINGETGGDSSVIHPPMFPRLLSLHEYPPYGLEYPMMSPRSQLWYGPAFPELPCKIEVLNDEELVREWVIWQENAGHWQYVKDIIVDIPTAPQFCPNNGEVEGIGSWSGTLIDSLYGVETEIGDASGTFGLRHSCGREIISDRTWAWMDLSLTMKVDESDGNGIGSKRGFNFAPLGLQGYEQFNSISSITFCYATTGSEEPNIYPFPFSPGPGPLSWLSVWWESWKTLQIGHITIKIQLDTSLWPI
jgi:hypothetical protein